MGTWYKVQFSIDDAAAGKHAKLQWEFSRVFVNSGFPAGAAMLATDDTGPEPFTTFFSPRAAVIADELIQTYGGRSCSAPKRSDVIPLVGAAPASDFSSE